MRTLNRLERVGETLRAKLNELATVAPEWLQTVAPPAWYEWDWDCPVLVDTLTLSSEVFLMPKTHPPYSPEFCRQMVELVRAGRLPGDLAREFEPTAQSIGIWVAQADKQEGRREEAAPGLTAAERDELARLRREVRQLRVERDILSEAAAWFARETGTLPGSSGS